MKVYRNVSYYCSDALSDLVIPREGVESIYEYVEETKVLDEM